MSAAGVAILCFVVALGATLTGSLSGLGGGVIIKPLLDVMAASQLALTEISALSSVTVFSMAVLSTVKGIRKGIVLKLDMFLPLAISSSVGGILGTRIFTAAMGILGENLCRNVQTVVLLLLMGIVLALYLTEEKCRRFQLESKWAVCAAGLSLGMISSFLGIGGGPINVVALKLLFAMNEREQVFGSLFIILFAQGSKLLSLLIAGLPFSTVYLPVVMIIGGIIGGSLGSSLAIYLPIKHIRKIFVFAVILVMIISMTALVK